VERRHRLLPARVVVYFTLAMCLWADEGYEEVARLLVGGLKHMARWRGFWRVPTTGAITQARARLGSEPLRELFARVAAATSAKGSVGSFWRGLRLVAIDGTVLDLPDTAANEEHFGRPGSDGARCGGPSPRPGSWRLSNTVPTRCSAQRSARARPARPSSLLCCSSC